MSLRPIEIQEIKNKLGYSNLTTSALPYVDVLLALEQFVQNNLDAYGETYIRETLLPNIRQLETDIFNVRTKVVASEVDGEVKIDPRVIDKLQGLRSWWIDRLSETVRCPRAEQLARRSAPDIY